MRQTVFLPLIHPAIVAVATMLLAGCVVATPEQRAEACQSTDWTRYGENDGRLGVPSGARADIFQDCADLGHPVNLAAYRAGRATGLPDYCTAQNGYRVGFEGRRYRGVCPPGLETDFVQGYRHGRSERPVYSVYPSIGIGVGTSSSVGLGFGWGGYYHPWYCRYRRCW